MWAAVQSVSVAARGARLRAEVDRIDHLIRIGRLSFTSAQEDTMLRGRRHERLQQSHRGVPVFGGQIVRQIDNRSALSVFGRLYEGIAIDVEPRISANQAALAALQAESVGATLDGEPLLGILPEVQGYVLSYRVFVRSPTDLVMAYVNAGNGRVSRRDSRLRTQTTAVGLGTGVLGDNKKLSVTEVTSGFQTVDRLRPAQSSTIDFRGSLFRLNLFLLTGLTFDADLALDSDNTWTDGAVVDAHVYQGWTYDYYFKRFGRRGLDDRNLAVRSIVHPLARSDAALYSSEIRALFINNALYAGDGVLIYGDGDGRNFDYLAGSLDVVAHELTHGVTDYTSQLDYRDEPGALNESFSDIMATSVEFMFQPQGSGLLTSDWLIGEDVTRARPGFLRSFANPHGQGYPDHYSLREFVGTDIDNGGVHVNANIVNHVYYLATHGGRHRVSGIAVPGIGLSNIERMENIFYRAFVFFLVPSSTFADARAATLEAADELYGADSNEYAQLALAWRAVGLN